MLETITLTECSEIVMKYIADFFVHFLTKKNVKRVLEHCWGILRNTLQKEKHVRKINIRVNYSSSRHMSTIRNSYQMGGVWKRRWSKYTSDYFGMAVLKTFEGYNLFLISIFTNSTSKLQII